MALVLYTCPGSKPIIATLRVGCSHKVNFHLRLLRTGLEERISGDISTVAVSRREIDPSVDQTFSSVILKRVVQYVPLS